MPRRRGSVTKCRDGWRVRLTVDGETQSFGVWPTEEEGDDALAAAIERADGRIHRTLQTWCKEWLKERETDRLHRDVHNERARVRLYVTPEEWAHWPLEDLKPKLFRVWVRKLLRDYARQTVCNALNVVRQALHAAVEAELLEMNPTIGVKVPKVPVKDRKWAWLTLEEIAAVEGANYAEGDKAAHTVGIYTGLRAGELWGLRWSDVRWSSRALDVSRSYDGPTKNGEPRSVPLLPPAYDALKRWHSMRPGIGDALVWPSETGSYRGRGNTACWPAAQRAAKLSRRVRLHDLRHTCASHLLQGSWPWLERPLSLAEVGQWLGHKSPRATERYAHLAPGAVKNLVSQLVTQATSEVLTKDPQAR